MVSNTEPGWWGGDPSHIWCEEAANAEWDEIVKLMAEKEQAPPTKDTEALKNDVGKPRWDLIPWDVFEEVVHVYTIGASKYADDNWRKGTNWSRIFRAMLSHAFKFWRGKKHDEKDGQHHLSSVIWCALALLYYERYNLGEDDRWIEGKQVNVPV